MYEPIGVIFLSDFPMLVRGEVIASLIPHAPILIGCAEDYISGGEIAMKWLADKRVVGVVAITPSGNGVQIYINKNAEFVAAPCSNAEMAIESVVSHGAKIIEVSEHLNIQSISTIFLAFCEALQDR